MHYQNLRTMKKSFYFTLTLLLFSFTIYCQTLPKRPVLSDVRAFNQANLLNIDIGMSKQDVIEKMGGVRSIQTYTSSDFMTRSKFEKISNPYSRDIKQDKDGNSIEILWYYTDIKEADDAINKDELTPIILENNKVVGEGWGFYEDYAKRKEITIDLK